MCVLEAAVYIADVIIDITYSTCIMDVSHVVFFACVIQVVASCFGYGDGDCSVGDCVFVDADHVVI